VKAAYALKRKQSGGRILKMIAILTILSPSACNAADVSHKPGSAEAREILSAICSASYSLDTVVLPIHYLGCKPCPSFTEQGDLPIGQKISFDLETVIYGSFTAPDPKEAVAALGGCADHAAAPRLERGIPRCRAIHPRRAFA
jgi:hypothetical protein